METTLNTRFIPQMDSIEQLAEFWDFHDVTDFEDGLEEVTELVFERLDKKTVRIDLPEKEFEVLEQIAGERKM
ncbi:MAG: CopG family antitoxin, partial [Anaerolineae bacterium]